MIHLLQRFANYTYFHIFCFSFLAILWIPMAFFGFHPHHEGLMLATLNLTSEAIKSGNSLPFNQYGPFWALPYLTIDLLGFGGFTFLAQRFLSIVLIFLSAALIRRISLMFYSRSSSLAIALLFLLTYPYGQPSIIWPSIPAQLALLVLTYSTLKAQLSQGKKYIFFASLSTAFLFGSRIQIGILSLILTIIVLSFTKRFNFLVIYMLSLSSIFTLMIVLLQRYDLLKDVIFDWFLFPLTYLNPGEQNWTFPRTSISFAVFLSLFYIVLCSLKSKKMPFSFLIITLSVSFVIFNITLFINQDIFLKLYSRLYVGVFLFLMMIGLMLSIKKFKLSGTYLRQQRIIFSYSLVGASQVFPTFDVFHAWYASAPIIIAIPSILKESRLQLKLSRNSIWKLNTALIIAMFTFFLFQAFQSISVEKKPFPLKEVRGIYLSEQQASDLHKEFAFFRRHIPRNAVILNVCGNPDPFFPRGYWSPGSRFFVFWPAISNYNFFPEDSYEVDFIIKCTEPGQNDWLNEVLSRNKFSKIETSGDVVSWGLRWEIYSRSSR